MQQRERVQGAQAVCLTRPKNPRTRNCLRKSWASMQGGDFTQAEIVEREALNRLPNLLATLTEAPSFMWCVSHGTQALT